MGGITFPENSRRDSMPFMLGQQNGRLHFSCRLRYVLLLRHKQHERIGLHVNMQFGLNYQ